MADSRSIKFEHSESGELGLTEGHAMADLLAVGALAQVYALSGGDEAANALAAMLADLEARVVPRHIFRQPGQGGRLACG